MNSGLYAHACDSIYASDVIHAIRNKESDKLPIWIQALYKDKKLRLEYNMSTCIARVYIDCGRLIHHACEDEVIVYFEQYGTMFVYDAHAFKLTYKSTKE